MDRVIAPVALFICLYVSALIGLFWLRLFSFHWAALLAVIIATAATVGIWDRGQWRLGLFVHSRRAVTELAYGLAFATILIGLADLLVVMTTDVRHAWGRGFPSAQLLSVFLPAVVHEELLFRGYPFQRVWRMWPRVAVLGCSAAFAVMHLWNDYITPLAVLNIFLGGVLLSLAYARYERLWFPIGLHLAWNLMSGPILGYSVSGFGSEMTVLRVIGRGDPVLTGGPFGLEGSVWMTVLEGAAVVILWRAVKRSNVILSRAHGEGSPADHRGQVGGGSFGVSAPQDDTTSEIRNHPMR
jgi:hypothetical protein